MDLTKRAKELRKHQTDAEKKLWYYLRNRNFFEYKFRRQVVVGSYIVDFLCHELRLIVELDGSQHMNQQDYDEARTAFLQSKDFVVVRFWNHEVLAETDIVLEALTLTLSQRGVSALNTWKGWRGN